MRLRLPESRARRHLDHQAGLIAIFGRRGAFDHLHRLHGVERDLIREDFALLVGDGLAVERERVRSVIAE